jgi:hypothetical protein
VFFQAAGVVAVVVAAGSYAKSSVLLQL